MRYRCILIHAYAGSLVVDTNREFGVVDTMRMRKLDVHVRQYLFVPSAYPRLFDSRWVSCIASHRPITVSFEQTRIPSTKICDCCCYYTGISRDSWHKRRATGGKKTPLRKKRKFELGRAAANTKVHNNFVNFLYLLCFCVWSSSSNKVTLKILVCTQSIIVYVLAIDMGLSISMFFYPSRIM